MSDDASDSKIRGLFFELGEDAVLMRELVAIYGTQSREFLASVDGGVPQCQLAELTHKLAGSTAQLGPDGLVSALLDLELLLRDGEAQEDSLTSVGELLASVHEALEGWVENL